MLHNLINNGTLSKLKLIKLIIENKLDITDMCLAYPKYAPLISHYFNEYVTLKYQTEKVLKICRVLVHKFGFTKKEISSYISDFPFATFVFKGLDNNKSFDEILEGFNSKEKAIYNRIEAYNNGEEFSNLIVNFKRLLLNLYGTGGLKNDEI